MVTVLKDRQTIIEAFDKVINNLEKSILGMYNSRLRAIITDPLFMVLHIDDHMAHRGHAVFDTLTVHEGLAYNLPSHLSRIITSASLAQIALPLTPEEISSILLDLAASTGKLNLYIRYWISSGPGSFAITPVEGESTFYAVAYESNYLEKFENINEFTVSVPLKPKLLANMKSNNYMLNALSAMESSSKGGLFGVQKDENGFITEGCVNNFAFVLPNKIFVTPTFDKILKGTGISRTLELVKSLVNEKLLDGIEQRDIHIDEAKTAVEMLCFCGDGVLGVLNWDGNPVGNGEEGEITKKIKEMYIGDFFNTEMTVPIDYSKYS
ncbi:hypothetical protein SteCoe_26959 [Stentor coeruleus]|uniref:Branched-chain amino acid aminotransferase n=1 Tax=Stentor coeruleus TaxID=5963 RepID=A0A1R2BBP6_9CILI|nr:hypothetical protein SteCoe_26959 [Stentor coeruleus]